MPTAPHSSVSSRDMVQNIRHALLTPLSSMVNLTDLLLFGASGELSETAKRDIQAVEADIQSLVQLFNKVMELVQIDASGLERRSLQLSPLLTKVVQKHAKQAQPQGKSFHLEVLGDLPAVLANKAAMHTILNHLLNQAGMFLGPEIFVTAWAHSDQVVVSVGQTAEARRFSEMAAIAVPVAWLRDVLSLEWLMFNRLVELHGGRSWAVQGTDLTPILYISIP